MDKHLKVYVSVQMWNGFYSFGVLLEWDKRAKQSGGAGSCPFGDDPIYLADQTLLMVKELVKRDVPMRLYASSQDVIKAFESSGFDVQTYRTKNDHPKAFGIADQFMTCAVNAVDTDHPEHMKTVAMLDAV